MTNEQAAAEYAKDKNAIFVTSVEDMSDIALDNTMALQAAFLAGIAFAEGRKWIRLRDELPEKYLNVLFLTENGEMFNGFINLNLHTMQGCQGRWASRYNDVENTITHWQTAPPKPDDNG